MKVYSGANAVNGEDPERDRRDRVRRRRKVFLTVYGRSMGFHFSS
jgi:hypothetical protein